MGHRLTSIPVGFGGGCGLTFSGRRKHYEHMTSLA